MKWRGQKAALFCLEKFSACMGSVRPGRIVTGSTKTNQLYGIVTLYLD